MSILIVDDSPVARLHLHTLLVGGGHTDVLTAVSAADAFRLLNVDGQQTEGAEQASVDLVLLDIVMPDVDGVAACRRLKATAHLCDVPVIMVTAQTESERLAAAFAAGATDYITKPAEPVELLARVRAALRLKEETDRRKAQEREVSAQLQRALVAERALAQANAHLAMQAVALTDELERRWQAEAALAERARLDGALLVARTVTHEINNAISPVVGYAELLSLIPAVGADPTAAGYARSISEAAAHVADRVRRLRQVTRLEESALQMGPGQPVLALDGIADATSTDLSSPVSKSA
jgi:DNA-binding response OmpR family regulator